MIVTRHDTWRNGFSKNDIPVLQGGGRVGSGRDGDGLSSLPFLGVAQRVLRLANLTALGK